MKLRNSVLKMNFFFFFDFPGGPEDKNMPANAGGMDLIPGPGRFHMLRGN